MKKNHPRVLESYIVKAHSRAMEGNQADHRPTYRAELDQIEKECEQNYKRGLRFLAAVSADDRARCRRLYEHQHGNTYGADELEEVRISRETLLIPRYVGLITEVRKLKKAIG